MPENITSKISNQILISGANLSMALNKTFKDFIKMYMDLHDA